MGTLIAGLKWLALFLENRFPKKLNLQNLATKDEVAATRTSIANLTMELEAVKTDTKRFKEQMEKISLLIGLSRPMQTILKQGVK